MQCLEIGWTIVRLKHCYGISPLRYSLCIFKAGNSSDYVWTCSYLTMCIYHDIAANVVFWCWTYECMATQCCIVYW